MGRVCAPPRHEGSVGQGVGNAERREGSYGARWSLFAPVAISWKVQPNFYCAGVAVGVTGTWEWIRVMRTPTACDSGHRACLVLKWAATARDTA